MTSMPLFGKITILSLSFLNFRVSRFHVSHLTHETFKLCLQNTRNMSKTARVYFGVLHLHSLVHARGASFSLKELHGHLPLHRQAKEARLGAEAEDKAHMQGHQGFRGVSTPLYHRLSQRISQLYGVRFCYLAYGQECYLILVLCIHSSLHQL